MNQAGAVIGAFMSGLTLGSSVLIGGDFGAFMGILSFVCGAGIIMYSFVDSWG